MRLSTAWGGTLIADPTHSRGLAIHNTGVFDIAASEAITRLVDPGELVVDGGANIGYMAVLAAYVAGVGGSVLAFEPHPDLFASLSANAELAGTNTGCAHFELRCEALGRKTGKAWLTIPDGFNRNDGIATLLPVGETGHGRLEVSVTTLDMALGDRVVGLLKLDIEGFEAEALHGAVRLLGEGRVRDVLFEDHSLGLGEATIMLRGHGFEVFSLGWALGKPVVQPLTRGILAKDYEAPNFIATMDPSRLLERFKPGGWKTLADLTSNNQASRGSR